MSLLNRTLAAALVAGGVASFTAPAGAVPLAASQSLRDAAPSAVETVRWRGRGWGGVGFGLATAAIIGGAIAASRPYYGYGYGYSGYGYPAYAYGYPAYGYAYAPSYSYAYAPAYAYAPLLLRLSTRTVSVGVLRLAPLVMRGFGSRG